MSDRDFHLRGMDPPGQTLCYCKECGCRFRVPAIARCPVCYGRHLAPVQESEQHVRNLLEILESVLDSSLIRECHADGSADFGPWFRACEDARRFLDTHGSAVEQCGS